MGSRKLDNWIKAYLAYTYESVSPEEYHKWTALSCIAGALRRRVFFDMSYFLLYPNLYTVLVGPPGRCKKSTAMRIGRGMLSEVPVANFTTDSTTRERLIQDLSQAHVDGHSSMTAFSSEFASLLTSSGADMVVFLTDIYDCPNEWAHKTKVGGTNKIKAPYLNMLAATTPDWISKAMPLDTVGIGLTSRIIFVFQDTPRIRRARPKLTPEQVALRGLLIEDLNTMSQLAGEYTFTKECDDFYEDWNLEHQKNPNPIGDPRLSGYFERKPMHAVKIAMLLAASFRDELVITVDDLQLALSLLAEVEERMPQVFANVGKNPLAMDYDDVQKFIQQNGGADFAALMRTFKHSVNKEELANVLDTLISMNKVTARGKKYVPLEDQKDDKPTD